MYRTSRWKNAAPVFALMLVLAAVLVGCGGDSGTTTTAAPATGTTGGGAAVDATALFSANCASCHGADGAGNIGPDLRALDDTTAITTQITNGGGAMPAFADKLSTEEIDALATYVVGLE